MKKLIEFYEEIDEVGKSCFFTKVDGALIGCSLSFNRTEAFGLYNSIIRSNGEKTLKLLSYHHSMPGVVS